ncbi:UNVERIFIED_ORG: hypothetical protein M2438_001573 [Methylobacterium sp. SuP10 SLI 274]|uniref:hypothetical protein n=1 Tax=Methylorubrum extorquens TaxID=408 RepID=UPI00209EE27A|nr:hypothetical protein [Methylorubrum extorquens]MDF9862787.1 hypothetical protein [Methylorubrum pseudosasae]MDH6636398.1 hypothetical protein [Methylobacterium sp. SuP10 SLI 274]MDH6665578.1 hypothetical protein [Methylorubrum zatmanii]MCP1557496.1 hypothetical protein [Methylorubrum extorquens]MDF9791083.1 hypothetical protein [Methylorubrum extorquens]
MSFPKKGNSLHSGSDGGAPSGHADTFAAMVSAVLRRSVGGRPSAVKLVARWTGARERTVKNWFAGSCAPKGDHFRELVRHCPEMLDAFLVSVDRQDHLAIAKLGQVEAALMEALAAIAKLKR